LALYSRSFYHVISLDNDTGQVGDETIKAIQYTTSECDCLA